MAEAAPTAPARAVLQLALPAFVALVAEPAFLLTDSAIVGRLGTVPLAALAVAAAVLTALTGGFVFLAYGTTAAVARRAGAGDLPGALGRGVDGVWLAAVLGVLAAAGMAAGAGPLAGAVGASAAVSTGAVGYLRISALGVPATLVLLSATGVLRGLADTRTPLVVAVAGFGANAALNLTLVHGAGLGLGGSAIGTVIAQNGMAAALLVVVVRAVRRHRAPLRPRPRRLLGSARAGVPLLVRTLALRGALLATTWAAAGAGDEPLAAYQVASTVFAFLAFALDALAIAAQVLTGRALGAGDTAAARALTRLMTRWGVGAGVALGALVASLHRVLPPLFTSDAGAQQALAGSLLVVALLQPLAGYVFVLDGVLIGAGDARWLAGAQTAVLVAYLPVAVLARATGLTAGALWWAFGVFVLARAVALAARARGDRWLVVGADR